MGQTGTAAAAATRAGVRSPMVVRSRATDGRSASSGRDTAHALRSKIASFPLRHRGSAALPLALGADEGGGAGYPHFRSSLAISPSKPVVKFRCRQVATVCRLILARALRRSHTRGRQKARAQVTKDH
jgi:hypothetical protein